MTYRQPVQVLVHPVRWTDDGWRYLMLRRIPHRGGFWQGVSGGVEWGEALADAARRELGDIHPSADNPHMLDDLLLQMADSMRPVGRNADDMPATLRR